jgi:hypothetical protein
MASLLAEVPRLPMGVAAFFHSSTGHVDAVLYIRRMLLVLA